MNLEKIKKKIGVGVVTKKAKATDVQAEQATIESKKEASKIKEAEIKEKK